ncbi:MAG TPA: hypothetical protein VMT30_02685 [Candidatus Saccharimonadia bacterium]|nr:hypothetical protein [Candidatus Saccharimonadia bacterium]
MHQRTSEVVRGLLSNKIREVLSDINRPVGATPPLPGNMVIGLVGELDAYSAALVDFMRAGQSPDNDVALSALDALIDGAGTLAELDAYFDKGTGKGSVPHKLIRRLRVIAEHQLPVIEVAAE